MTEPEFSVSTASLDGCVTVSVSGELDEVTAPELEAALDSCDGDRPVVVDLTALTFISSAGIRLLLKERPTGSPAVLVVSPGSHVARVFDIVGASERIPLCSDLGAAMQLCGGTAPS